ncbi:MAG: MBL fold metallo-hydrolase [Dehalococcoidia bacterium]|nr:MAG: MBL fold metallo-hydrolase [Dehalococcoidia bacterium]
MIIEEVAEKVYRLETPISGTDAVFAVYLIKESGGALIEPGPSAAVPSIREVIGQLEMKELTYIIPTHIHVDHAGGTGTLAQIFPDARVIVHPAGMKHVVDPSRLIESTKNALGPNFEDIFGSISPVPKSRIKTPDDGEIISLNSRDLQIIYAPGHAPHHIVIFDKRTKGLFCGEALGIPGGGNELIPLPAVAPPSFDQELYLETMEKLRKLGADILFYSHGGIGREPDTLISIAAENTRAIGDIILDALKRGEVVESIGRKVGQYTKSRFGLELSDFDQAMMVGAHALYFTKKGLV